MKKLLCLLLALFMLSFAMISCTDGEENDGSESDTTIETNDTNDSGSETVTDEEFDEDYVIAPDAWFQ